MNINPNRAAALLHRFPASFLIAVFGALLIAALWGTVLYQLATKEPVA